jgi:hypothetical protein
MRVGLYLSTEEHGPHELLDQPRRAADVGMHGLWISDHCHPWTDDVALSPQK